MNLTVTTKDFCTMAILFTLILEWLPFVFLGVGAILSVFGFFQMKRSIQENSLNILNNFKVSLQAHDIANWKELYLGTSETAAPPAGCFLDQTGQFVALDTMWTAGNADHTAVQRMAESLEKVCVEILKPGVDIKIIWHELGQLMTAMHRWLGEIPGVSEELTFLQEQYPSLKKVFVKHAREFKKWPYHLYIKD